MEEKEILISVVIPTYNRSNYLIEALNSVINQTYKNIEIIIVDDGSKDNTKEIVNNYIELNKIKNIKYYYKDNGGVATARNFGIQKSEGIFISFLDSDDLWKEDKLLKQIKLFNDPKIGLVHSHYSILKEDNQLITNIPEKEEKFNGNMYSNMKIHNLVGTSTVVIRKECIDKVGFFEGEYSPAEDYDLWLRISKEYDFGYISESLVYYREFSSENISRNLTKLENGVIKILNKHWDNISITKSEKEDKDLAYSRFYSYLSTNYYEQENKEKFIEYYLKACNISINNQLSLPKDFNYIHEITKNIKDRKILSFTYFKYSKYMLKEKRIFYFILYTIYSFIKHPIILISLLFDNTKSIFTKN
ncbi:MAG: glycosyltransferase family 2 protein [Candidatus Sericytochromatia bacterium]